MERNDGLDIISLGHGNMRMAFAIFSSFLFFYLHIYPMHASFPC